jgi:hypothetical protein
MPSKHSATTSPGSKPRRAKHSPNRVQSELVPPPLQSGRRRRPRDRAPEVRVVCMRGLAELTVRQQPLAVVHLLARALLGAVRKVENERDRARRTLRIRGRRRRVQA